MRNAPGTLQRWYGGEASALAVVRVPSVAEEDARRLHREREYLVRERTREGNRLKSLLVAQGIRVKGEVARWGAALDRFRTGDGEPLPPCLREELGRGELAASVGLVPMAYDSGQSRREQGLSKSGNRRVRAILIELAWGWLRYQPDSTLSRWWQTKFSGSVRGRKVGIVALARKLSSKSEDQDEERTAKQIAVPRRLTTESP